MKGKLRDYTFINRQSGRNWHYLWLREHKALFEYNEVKFFGNDVAAYARQDQPVVMFIQSDDINRMSDPDASIQLRGLTIGNKVLFEKDETDSSGLGSLLLSAAMGFLFIALLIFLVQRWLLKF